MKTGTLIAAALVAASFGALSASADQNVCTPGNEACVSTWGYSGGNGTCDDTSSYAYSSSGAAASTYLNNQGNVVVVQYGCYSDLTWGEYHSSYFDVYTYQYGSDYSYAELYWYGYSGDFGEGCGTALYTYGYDGVPNYTDLGCNAGSPPTGLPVLP